MNFRIIVIGKKRKQEDFSAKNAEEARKLANGKFPKADEMILYQLIGKAENPEFFGQEFSRSWGWDGVWYRSPGGTKRDSLEDSPDSLTDEQVHKKYLAALSS